MKELPWEPIIAVITWAALFTAFLFKLHFDNQKNKAAIEVLQKENSDLKKELREMKDILIKVEYATGQLMLGRIKTGTRE